MHLSMTTSVHACKGQQAISTRPLVSGNHPPAELPGACLLVLTLVQTAARIATAAGLLGCLRSKRR